MKGSDAFVPLGRRLGIQAALWIAAALAVRLAHFAFVADSPLTLIPTSDEYEHWDLARYLASTDWLGAARGAYHRPQLFAYVLGVLVWLTGGRIYWVHLALLVFDSVAVGLLWLAARQGFSRRVAFWGALAAVTYWPFVHFSATLYMESFALLVQAGLLLAVAVAVRRLARRSRPADLSSPAGSTILPAQVYWAGALTGLLVLTRPQTILAVPVLLAGLAAAGWWGSRSRMRAALAPLLFAAMMVLVLLPNAVRNYVVSGQWIWYSSNGALNFYLGNNDRGISWESVSPGMEWTLFIDLPQVEEGIGQDRAARIDYWRRKSLEYVTRHPRHFLANLYDKALLVWNARIVHCTNNFEWMAVLSPVQRWLPGFWLWGTLSVAGLALAGVRVARAGRSLGGRRGKAPPRAAREWDRALVQAVLGGYAVLYLGGVALFLAIERHRLLPLAPLFLFGGLWGSEWVGAIRARQWGRVVAAGAAVALAAVLVNMPLRGEDLRAHEQYWTRVNLGVACGGLADRTGDETWLDKAHDYFIAAYQIYPTRLEPLRQLTSLAERRGRFGEALEWDSRMVMRLERDYPGQTDPVAEELAHNLVLALKANQAGEAIETGIQLVRRMPANPQAHHLLGVAWMAAGKKDQARGEFEQTLRLAPEHSAARENLKLLDRETSPTRSGR